MDIIEITPDNIDLDNIEFDSTDIKPSVNFGPGIELLMNDKTKNDKTKSSTIDIDDLNNLEDELNDLSNDTKSINNKYNEIENNDNNINLDFNNNTNNTNNKDNIKIQIGKSTSEMNENKTWDGYSKINNIPLNEEEVKKPKLTKEEELREKFKYLKKLEDLEKKGATLTKRYNMDSDLNEMMGEYETIISEKEKSNAIKFQGKMLMACITGIEFLNNKFDPFDIKLDGWAEQLNENIDEYDELFGELHDKYKSKAKMSPELKLLFQLGGSAMMVHMSNTLFKSSMPGMDDIMKQNPELMKQFTQAAVNTMGQTNPGFGGFMNSVFNQNNNEPNIREFGVGSGANPGFSSFENSMPPNANIGPPPEPSETKLPERSKRDIKIPNRPDITNARSSVDLNQNKGDPFNEQRIRPEMRGPSTKQESINNLLGGLKTKHININEEKDKNESSTISVEDMKDLNGVKAPKSKRKQKSDKNTISLDI